VRHQLETSTTLADHTTSAAQRLLHLPNRGHLGVLLSIRPLKTAMREPLLLGIVTDSLGHLSRWPADLSYHGVLGDLVEIVSAICR
jgi:hypothetical protein